MVMSTLGKMRTRESDRRNTRKSEIRKEGLKNINDFVLERKESFFYNSSNFSMLKVKQKLTQSLRHSLPGGEELKVLL